MTPSRRASSRLLLAGSLAIAPARVAAHRAADARAAGPGRALVQGQHAHAYDQQRRRQFPGRRRAVVSRSRLSVPRPERSQRPHVHRGAECAPRPRRQFSLDQGRGGHGPLRRKARARQRPRRRRARRAARRGTSLLDVVQRNVDAIRQVRGVPHINHPNFGWALTTDVLQQVRRMKLLEIYNGHPQVNNLGGGGVPGLEEAWDAVLSSGTTMYGIAVDDAHTFKQPGNPAVAGPGRGWVMVRAERLDAARSWPRSKQGQFYASTGVELTDIVTTSRSLTVTVKKDTWSKYRIQFIGKGGRGPARSARQPGRVHLPRRRRLRARQGPRKQRSGCLGTAGGGEVKACDVRTMRLMLKIADCRLADCGLSIADCRFRADCRARPETRIGNRQSHNLHSSICSRQSKIVSPLPATVSPRPSG